jgi:hypothetical protein
MATDKTASSKAFEKGIRTMYAMILEPLVSRVASVKVSHLLYGDLDCNEPMVLLTNGGDVRRALEDSQKIVFEGGGDPPETHLDAFERLIRIVPWNPDRRRARGVVLGFCTANTKPARSGITAAQLGTEMQNRGILLYMVAEPFPWAQGMVEAANGFLFPITNSPDPAELKRISGEIAASIPLASSPGGTTPMRPSGPTV